MLNIAPPAALPDPDLHTGRATILIAEDEEHTLRGTATLLRNAGYRVIEARDGYECLAAARRVRPELVLLELALPGLNGFEVAGLLRRREETSASAIVALTASWLGNSPEALGGLGFDCALRKPCQPQQLLDTVRDVLAAALRLQRDGGTLPSDVAPRAQR